MRNIRGVGPHRAWLVVAAVALVALSGCGSPTVEAADGQGDAPNTVQPSDTPTSAEVDPDLPSDEGIRSFVEALATNQVGPMEGALQLTKRGSAAHGYLRYLIQGGEAMIDGGLPSEPQSDVTTVDDGFEMCSPGTGAEQSCYAYADFEGKGGKIVDFTVNKRPIGARLVLGSGEEVTGSNGLRGTFVAAFETSDGEALVVGYRLRTREAAFMVDVTYRSPSGRQSTSTVITGPTDLGADSLANFQSYFPGAEHGGVVTVNMYSESATLEQSVSFDTATK